MNAAEIAIEWKHRGRLRGRFSPSAWEAVVTFPDPVTEEDARRFAFENVHEFYEGDHREQLGKLDFINRLDPDGLKWHVRIKQDYTD